MAWVGSGMCKWAGWGYGWIQGLFIHGWIGYSNGKVV